MITQINSSLKAILGNVAVLKSASGAGRVFELFIMTGIARELKSHGYEVWLERSDETRIKPTDITRDFIQRGGAPTGLASKFAGDANASFIVFRKNKSSPEWEIWNGIQFVGRSQGTHEIDLAVVPRVTGQALRGTSTGGMPIGRPRISIECKDVKNAGSSDEMRAFIARLYDLTLLDSHLPYMPSVTPFRAIFPSNPADPLHVPATTYREENLRTFNALVRRSGFSKGATTLTTYYGIQPYQYVLPKTSSTSILFTAVKNWCVTKGL